MLGDSVGKEVFLLRAGAVHHLDRIDIVEHLERAATRPRIAGVDRRSFMNELETRVELIAKRMVGNEKTADVVDYPAELFDLVDPTDILVEAESANVPPFGGHFDTAEQHHPALLGVVFKLRVGPGVIVFGDTDPVEADLLRLVNQGKRIEVAVRAATRGVDVEIDEHVLCLPCLRTTRRRHLYTVFSHQEQESERSFSSGLRSTLAGLRRSLVL